MAAADCVYWLCAYAGNVVVIVDVTGDDNRRHCTFGWVGRRLIVRDRQSVDHGLVHDLILLRSRCLVVVGHVMIARKLAVSSTVLETQIQIGTLACANAYNKLCRLGQQIARHRCSMRANVYSLLVCRASVPMRMVRTIASVD